MGALELNDVRPFLLRAMDELAFMSRRCALLAFYYCTVLTEVGVGLSPHSLPAYPDDDADQDYDEGPAQL